MEVYCQVNSPKLIELLDENLSMPPVPSRHYLLRRLALLSLQFEACGKSHRNIEDLLAERGTSVSPRKVKLPELCVQLLASARCRPPVPVTPTQ